MDLSPVIIAIPMYFTLMAIELVYESITNRRTYRLNDAITNISTGTLQQLSGTFLHIVKVGLYVLMFEYVALKVAVKMFTAKFVTKHVFNEFQEEISVLCGLEHPNIVQILGIYIDNARSLENKDSTALMIMYELMP